MSKGEYKIKSVVIVYPGLGGWRFLPLPKKEGKEIKELFGTYAKKWGSLPVLATIGKTSWETSIFPDKKSGTYLLPLKVQIRKIEKISDSDSVLCILKIRTDLD